MMTHVPTANAMCMTCIHIGSDVTRVSNHTSIYQRPGCASSLTLRNRSQIEELAEASMKDCSSSRHIACRNVRTMSMAMRRKNSPSLTMVGMLGTRARRPLEPAVGVDVVFANDVEADTAGR